MPATEHAVLKPGWYVRLEGHEWDLEDWRDALSEPFDPVAVKLPDGETGVRSEDFKGLDHKAVRERGLVLVARLNGALGVHNGTQPVRFAGVVSVDEAGKTHRYMFAEGLALMARSRARATAIVLGPDGKPLPPPPPQASIVQKWNEMATGDDDISDLLDHFGRADNWYDIYKTIEIAADLLGGKHKLWKALAPEAAACRNLDQNANFYRHARGARPPAHVLELSEARPLLTWLVRRVLDRLSE